MALHFPDQPEDLGLAVFSRRALQRPWPVILGYLVLLLAALPGLLMLRLDNTPEVFFLRDAETLAAYERFEFDFGRDRVVRVVAEGPGLWSREGLDWLASLEGEARKVRGVAAAAGLAAHHRRWLPEWPPEDPQAFRRMVRGNLLDREAGWVSADGRVISVLVAFYRMAPDLQRKTLGELEGLLAEAPPGVQAFLVGLPVVERALDGALLRMARVFFPLLAALSLALLWWAFGDFRHALRPLVFVGTCEAVVLGGFGWCGLSLDLVTIVLVPLLFVVALATAIHVQVRYLAGRGRGLDRPRALAETVSAKVWPVLWTGVTTSLGFGSLGVARLPAVRTLGVGAAIAFAFMTAAALTLLPALLALDRGWRRPHRRTALRDGTPRWSAWVAEAAVRHRRGALWVFGFATMAALAGTVHLESETGLLRYFRAQHPVREQLHQLERAGMDVASAELVLTGSSDRWQSEAALRRLEELAAELRELPRVSGVFGAGDLVADASVLLSGVSGRSTTLDEIRSQPELDLMLRYFLAREGRRTRITLRLPMAGHQALEPTLVAAEAAAKRAFPEAEVEVTGRYPLVLAARDSLQATMGLSLVLTLVCIAAIFRGLLGSSALALRALLPNLWPVAAVLGLMGWWRESLEPTTVMIAASVLGLAVDDTLHTLAAYRRSLPSSSPPVAARRALEELAGAHTLTSLVLAAGFGACALSSFVPVERFGALTALGVAASLAGDLWLAPALLAGASEEEVSRFLPAGGGEA